MSLYTNLLIYDLPKLSKDKSPISNISDKRDNYTIRDIWTISDIKNNWDIWDINAQLSRSRSILYRIT